jgi:hypothetical protein
MQDQPESVQNNKKFCSQGFWQGFLYFLFLIVLPLATFYLAFYHVQISLEHKRQQSALDEMSEITAHMSRLTDPESFFQDQLKRLAESFRWASSPQEIPGPGYDDAIQLFLFDEDQKRIEWDGGERGKIRISEDYLSYLINIKNNPGKILSRRDQSIASSFTGNSSTVYTLARSQDTLVNFQGLGLRKFGGWYRARLPGGETGHLLAFIEPDEVSKHHLAEKAIRKIKSFTGDRFQFAWLDLNHPKYSSVTGNLKFSEEGRKLLGLTGLKSGFKYENYLFSINDTLEGIRLICARPLPNTPELLQNYQNSLLVFIPVIFLFLIWKSIFSIRFNFPISIQFALVFGYTAVFGIIVLLSGITAFQMEKQSALTADKKHEAIKMLEKIDRSFTASYGDLLRQYRHLSKNLKDTTASTTEILMPLQQAYEDESIAFASYCDIQGNYLFKAPQEIDETKATGLEAKYARLVNSVSSELLKTYNSSRLKGEIPNHDVIGITSISSKPVEGLLRNRSGLQNITFDGDDTITFVDLVTRENDHAHGCLFIVHRPSKLQINYLRSSGKIIERSTGFKLAAFPKDLSDKKMFFPRYSFFRELPLWKLQDLVNQTQVSSFKAGKIDQQEVLVAATPGHNLRNFNLFLIMPMAPIQAEARQLTMLFLLSTILTLLFIAFLSGMLIRSLVHPIHHLAQSALSLSNHKSLHSDQIDIPEGNELESISTGLADLIIKVREFKDGRTIKRHLLPPGLMQNGNVTCDGFQIIASNNEREIYHFAPLSTNETLVFFMRTDIEGIEGTLNLTMARMAVRLISEELNVLSSYRILRNLEEYFRINLRRKLSGDFFIGIFDNQAKNFAYSGSGAIKVCCYSQKATNLKRLDIPSDVIGSTEFHNFASQTIDLKDNTQIFILSPILSTDCLKKISEIASETHNIELSHLKEQLEIAARKECSHEFKDAASLLILDWKEQSEKT